MQVEVQVNNSASPGARFLSWAPSPCRIRLTDRSGIISASVAVKISAVSSAGGGAVVFRTGASGAFANEITVLVPASGASVNFFAAGKFGSASRANGDVTIRAVSGIAQVGATPVMVRIRKNANTLTAGERNRLVAAFAQLNNRGAGRFTDFRDMHTAVSSPQAHGQPAFLPWHRAYLLDLERELQAIDPSVALPYWRFDAPAPNVFTRDFMGESDPLGRVQFSAGNPLLFWTTDSVLGIDRRPFFTTATQSAFVINEAQTLALGAAFSQFRNLEGNPHGSAHTSFGGFISSIPTAARDPLFFLLHCNVDRLWAKWQRQNSRFNPTLAASYVSGSFPPGHNLGDSMWPWNGVTGGTRPPTAPGGAMAVSPCTGAPGTPPRVRDCIDFQGVVTAAARMAFDYDDVPFA